MSELQYEQGGRIIDLLEKINAKLTVALAPTKEEYALDDSSMVTLPPPSFLDRIDERLEGLGRTHDNTHCLVKDIHSALESGAFAVRLGPSLDWGTPTVLAGIRDAAREIAKAVYQEADTGRDA